MMWRRRHSFGEVAQTDEQVVIVAIEVWGAHARALPGKEEPRAIMLRELRKPGTFIETFTPTKRLTLRIRRLDPLCALC